MPIRECILPEGGKGWRWGNGHCYPDRADAEKQAAAAHANGWTGDIALDASARTIDIDGRMHISKSHISKAGVNPYYGREIPGYEALGLQPDKIYQMLRDPGELAKGAHTFERNQILSKHIPVSADQPRKDFVVGAIGSDVAFNDPYLDADLCIWDAGAIAGIESEQVQEISGQYHYKPVMTPGVFKGEPYDGVMTEIIGNGIALVEAGRAGSDVVAADSNPFQRSNMTKLGKAIETYRTLAKDAAVPAEKLRLAMDAVIEATEDPEPKEPKKEAAKDKKAKDSESEEEKKQAEDEDETEEEKKERLEKRAKDKKAKDAEPEKEEEKEKKSEKAMDARIEALRSEFKQADEARRDVRPTVGDVIAQDSAESIYGFALDQMKVDHAGVTGVPALRALYKVASSKSTDAPRIAMDAATLTVSKIPGFDRARVM